MHKNKAAKVKMSKNLSIFYTVPCNKIDTFQVYFVKNSKLSDYVPFSMFEQEAH